MYIITLKAKCPLRCILISATILLFTAAQKYRSRIGVHFGFCFIKGILPLNRFGTSVTIPKISGVWDLSSDDEKVGLPAFHASIYS